jgi:predicted CXXCH cytochrome family protein
MSPRLSIGIVVALLAGQSAGASEAVGPSGQTAESCVTSGCHAPLISGAAVHAPAAIDPCKDCHQPLEGDHRFRPLDDPVGPLCLSCHDDPARGRAQVHAPVSTGDCAVCHDPHSAAEPMLLWSEATELCTGCHSRVAEELTRPHIHGAVQDLGCTGCHDPHAAAQAALLPLAGNRFCDACHRAADSLAPEVDPGVFIRAELTRDYIERIPKVSLRTSNSGHPTIGHPVSGDEDPRGTGREFWCGSCHEVHGAYRSGLRTGSEQGFCAGCHWK